MDNTNHLLKKVSGRQKLDIFYHQQKVGTMALFQKRLAAFEYDAKWLLHGFSISPISLPLEKKVFMPKPDPFEGLFDLFLLGGSSGGARPKILTEYQGSDWIIKFPSSMDKKILEKQSFDTVNVQKPVG